MSNGTGHRKMPVMIANLDANVMSEANVLVVTTASTELKLTSLFLPSP